MTWMPVYFPYILDASPRAYAMEFEALHEMYVYRGLDFVRL
jgi:hypothetical protein